jgi:ubiquinone/menaquinone biosynthesis C-methylase UbiE
MTGLPERLRSDPHWVAARFDRIAPYYGLFERMMLVSARARNRAVENLALHVNQRVLCVGCGKGSELVTLSTSVGENGHVVGIDLSARMLRTARERMARCPFPNVELIQGDLLRYTTGDLFDAVYFPYSLSSFGDPQRALRHAFDLLIPGGVLVVLDGRLPGQARRLLRPAMPLIRTFLESTVLGDPDMRPIEEALELGQAVEVELFRGGFYFVATLRKPLPDPISGR